MKTYNQFGEFLFLRDTLVTYLVVHHQSPIQDILSLERVDDPGCFPWFEDGGITISRLASDYSRLCRNLLPDCLLLFPTDNGSPLKKHKYIKHVNTLLREAGGKPINLSDPITTKHLAQLLSLRFYYQRQRYQVALALGFLGHNALRPGEIA